MPEVKRVKERPLCKKQHGRIPKIEGTFFLWGKKFSLLRKSRTVREAGRERKEKKVWSTGKREKQGKGSPDRH